METVEFLNILMQIRGGRLSRIFCPDGNDIVTKIDVPRFVIYHEGTHIYDQFPNLQVIAAHPFSPCYDTYNGCLYKKSGELLYIPIGRESIRLSPDITGYDPKVFADHDKLREIDTSEATGYVFRDGCLYSADMTSLDFVTADTRRLFIPASVSHIGECVFERAFDTIEAEPGNPHWYIRDGALYTLSPWWGETLVRVLEGTEELALGENLRVEDRCLLGCHTLRKLSFPLSAEKAALAFQDRREDISFVLQESDGELPLHLNKALPLKKALFLLASGHVDAGPGTEYFYLELFLRGRITEPRQTQLFTVSVFRILSDAVDRDDAEMLSRVLRDGRLVTKRNIGRLRRLAREKNADSAAALLDAAEDLPERIAL